VAGGWIPLGYFELGSAPVEAVQHELDAAWERARRHGRVKGTPGTTPDLDLTAWDDPAVDLRSPMTAGVTGQGFETTTLDLVIKVSGLALPVALDIWRTWVLPALKDKFGDDAVGRETTDSHARHGGTRHS